MIRELFNKVPTIKSCHLLKTGQTISHHTGDDGDLELGMAKDFKVLSTGDQSGTTNIVINGKTHALSNNCVSSNNTYRNGRPIMWARYVPLADIGPAADGKLFWEQWTLAAESCTFNAAAKTITAAAGTPFGINALCVGRKIDLTGTASNNIEVTVTNITTSVITVSETLVNEGPVNTTFATKDDLIWNFLAQANANSLGGFTDWWIPNVSELISLVDLEVAAPVIDTTAFPSTPNTYMWTSTTMPNNAELILYVDFNFGRVTSYHGEKKLYKYFCRLVRS